MRQSIRQVKNPQIARIFLEYAQMLEANEVQWKPAAYRKAGQQISDMQEEVWKIYQEKGIPGLRAIPGVGEGIAKKIEQILTTGRMNEYEEEKKLIPVDFYTLTSLEGIGPKRAKMLYEGLGIRDIASLKAAVRKNSLSRLVGFGQKSQEKIGTSIGLFEAAAGRMSIDEAYRLGEGILSKLKSSGYADRLAFAGSMRRMKETIGDIDILATSRKPRNLMDYFTGASRLGTLVAKGASKSTIRLENGATCDLRLISAESFGAGLAYFTGSKEHNVHLRKIAISKGYKLNEYGLFLKSGRSIASKTEEDIYHKLSMQYVPPEMREDTGEVEKAQANALPRLVEADEIMGDFHVHTKYSDGLNSVEEMAKAAQKIGYEWVAISDHSSSTRIAHGLDETQLEKQHKDINALRGLEINVLKGAEMDILTDGSLDYNLRTLKKLDVVIASIHSGFGMDAGQMTKRVCKALDTGLVDILAHPSGRLIGQREGYQLDYDKVFDSAKSNGVSIEINAQPQRLDLKEDKIRQALGKKCTLAIGTDSHSISNLGLMRFGVGMARRGWAEKKDVLNCLSYSQLKKRLSERQ